MPCLLPSLGIFLLLLRNPGPSNGQLLLWRLLIVMLLSAIQIWEVILKNGKLFLLALMIYYLTKSLGCQWECSHFKLIFLKLKLHEFPLWIMSSGNWWWGTSLRTEHHKTSSKVIGPFQIDLTEEENETKANRKVSALKMCRILVDNLKENPYSSGVLF